MLQSKLFTKTKKEAPKDEVSKNAELLVRGGFVHKEMAGVYDLLPLGLRVFKKIEQIIREEMNAIGGQEIEMSSLQDGDLWKKVNKWDDDKVDIWFKTKLKNDTEVGLAFSHEEVIASMLKNHVSSYKDLPIFVYQIQKKFRNEVRAKSGILRGREFTMKDMYSFSRNEEELKDFYEKSKKAYMKIFERCGLGDITYITEADGSVFGPRSDEFQVLSEVGEDTIYADKDKKVAINEEVYSDEMIAKLGLNKEKLVKEKAIEAGNIFPIGTSSSDNVGLTYKDENGEEKPIFMGSYGIGVGRLMGTIAEVFADENGLVWPESVTPFKFHIVALNIENEDVKKTASEIYKMMENSGIEVLFDDRDKNSGEKFADSDLLGIPYRIVVSSKNLEENVLEIKNRKTGEVKKVDKEEILKSLLEKS